MLVSLSFQSTTCTALVLATRVGLGRVRVPPFPRITYAALSYRSLSIYIVLEGVPSLHLCMEIGLYTVHWIGNAMNISFRVADFSLYFSPD